MYGNTVNLVLSLWSYTNSFLFFKKKGLYFLGANNVNYFKNLQSLQKNKTHKYANKQYSAKTKTSKIHISETGVF